MTIDRYKLKLHQIRYDKDINSLWSMEEIYLLLFKELLA